MSPSSGRVEGTREAILNILRRRSGVGVEELARELGLAGATVRRHLDVLQRDNYVSVAQVRGGTGRPRHLFSLTEAGAELFPHHYVRLTHRLLEEIVGLDAAETAGLSGEAIADLVFGKMSSRLAREYAPRVEGETLEQRVRSAVALIGEEGLDFEVDSDVDAEDAAGGGSLRLLGRGCPCTRIHAGVEVGVSGRFELEATSDRRVRSCDHDRRMLEEVLGVPITALPPEHVPHEFQCGYLVHTR